jgi:hypothetical protein
VFLFLVAFTFFPISSTKNSYAISRQEV